jgi:hypothetical protein
MVVVVATGTQVRTCGNALGFNRTDNFNLLKLAITKVILLLVQGMFSYARSRL